MRRRTLDVLFSIGGVGLAGLLLVMGMVLTSNANFAQDYVKNQLTQQKIRFTPARDLTAEEKSSACVVEYAGQALTTGRQAECYANHFIALHLESIPNADGKTYAELGDAQSELRAQIAQSPAGSPLLGGLQKQLADLGVARETVFKGETLRGLLLTSYGFSVLGVKGGQVATVAYLAAAILALLAVAGFLHAWVTPRATLVAVPTSGRMEEIEPAVTSV